MEDLYNRIEQENLLCLYPIKCGICGRCDRVLSKRTTVNDIHKRLDCSYAEAEGLWNYQRFMYPKVNYSKFYQGNLLDKDYKVLTLINSFQSLQNLPNLRFDTPTICRKCMKKKAIDIAKEQPLTNIYQLYVEALYNDVTYKQYKKLFKSLE